MDHPKTVADWMTERAIELDPLLERCGLERRVVQAIIQAALDTYGRIDVQLCPGPCEV